MRKTAILAAIAVLTTQILLAQSQHPQSRPFNTRSGMASLSRPTKVTGEGVATPSGLRYWDILTGTGEAATKGRTVIVLYRAWEENGKEFASSALDKKPTAFTLGAGQVIPGLEEGVSGMKVGGRRQLRIPPNLAIGKADMQPPAPPNKTLIFDVELIELR